MNHASKKCLEGYFLDEAKFPLSNACKNDVSIISLNLQRKFFVKTFFRYLYVL